MRRILRSVWTGKAFEAGERLRIIAKPPVLFLVCCRFWPRRVHRNAHRQFCKGRSVDQLKLRAQIVKSTPPISILVVSALIIDPVLSRLELESLHLVRSEISMLGPADGHLKCKKYAWRTNFPAVVFVEDVSINLLVASERSLSFLSHPAHEWRDEYKIPRTLVVLSKWLTDLAPEHPKIWCSVLPESRDGLFRSLLSERTAAEDHQDHNWGVLRKKQWLCNVALKCWRLWDMVLRLWSCLFKWCSRFVFIGWCDQTRSSRSSKSTRQKPEFVVIRPP